MPPSIIINSSTAIIIAPKPNIVLKYTASVVPSGVNATTKNAITADIIELILPENISRYLARQYYGEYQ